MPIASAQDSVIRRYAGWLSTFEPGAELSPEHLAQVSKMEGIRAIQGPTIGGVQIVVIDETTRMSTGTYKALDACVTSATLLAEGVGAIVSSSGGNLTCALADYAARAGVRSFLFNPTSTMFKLAGDGFRSGLVHVIEVDRPEPEVKALARLFAQEYGLRSVPDVRWRFAASAFRALFLREFMEETGPLDWVAQCMCAGYGPVGIYNCFQALEGRGALAGGAVPGFLGFQQAANAAMAWAWRDHSREILASHVCPRPSDYREPGLYNTNPGENYTRLFDHINRYGGGVHPLDHDQWDTYADRVVDMLDAVGIPLSRVPETGQLCEHVSALTGIGILWAIDAGVLSPGQRVAFMVTGGTRPFGPERVEVAARVSRKTELMAAVHELGHRFGLRNLAVAQPTAPAIRLRSHQGLRRAPATRP